MLLDDGHGWRPRALETGCAASFPPRIGGCLMSSLEREHHPWRCPASASAAVLAIAAETPAAAQVMELLELAVTA